MELTINDLSKEYGRKKAVLITFPSEKELINNSIYESR